MPPGAKFSLAGALFGWEPAPGHAAPEQQAPDAWVLHFREHHAASDPAVLTGLLTACPAGRDWVLEAAPRVTLTLDTTAEQTPAQWQRRISTLSSTLSARGSRAVRLDIACDGSTQSSAAGYVLPSLLPGLDVAVTELGMRSISTAPGQFLYTPMISLLHAAVSAFAPHLTTLSLDPCPCALPPPDLLPQLRSLTLTTPTLDAEELQLEREVVRSIAPYTTQLTSLVINRDSDDWHIEWPDLTPATPSNTLTSLSISSMIDQELLELVTEKLPALQSLRGARLRIDEDFSDRVWGVRELALTECVCEPADWVDDEDADSRDDVQLCRLPRCQEGAVMTIRVEKVIFHSNEQGLMEGLRERLSEWRLDCKELTVYTDHLDGISEAQDFQNRLSQLCAGLQTTGGTRLCVGGFRWNARMLRGYVAAFPALAERGVGKHALMHIGPLTDALLGKVLKARAHITGLSVWSLALESGTHANTPWPWDELSVSYLDIADLCKLPDPAGAGAPRTVVCRELVLSARITQVGADNIISRLRHVQLSFNGALTRCLRLRCPHDGTPQAAALQAQLSVLRAARIGGVAPEERVPAHLEGWPQGLLTNKALEGLPEWALPMVCT